MERILVVEDDPVLCPLIARFLKQKGGFSVEMARTGEEARHWLEKQEFEVVVLDLMLPDENGLDLARSIRAESNKAIIIISALDDVVDRIVGLEVGADDYLTKPFDNRELLARVRTVLRRAKGQAKSASDDSGVIRFDGWRLDLTKRELTSQEGRRVALTVAEFDLLAALARHGTHEPCSREELHTLVFKREPTSRDRASLDNLVSRLRKKLERDPDRPEMIKTIRGAGYLLAAEVKPA
jgi:DNA-binding response OmpR family regulator